MVKFFRKLRLRFLSESQFTKYLLYAIGEIILVVIGILIALQINNWNENRKARERTQAIYSIIKEDLERDMEQIALFLENYDSIRKPVFVTLLEGNSTREDFDKNSNLHRGFRGYEDIQINTRGYDLFKNQPNNSILDQSLASEISTFYNEHIYEIEVAQQELSEEFSDNNSELKKRGFTINYVLGLPNEPFIEYTMNDPDAKNRLATYYLFYSIYAEELRNFNSNARVLIKKIDNVGAGYYTYD